MYSETSFPLKTLFLKPDQSLSDALTVMNETGMRAMLVVDDTETLLGLVTDGDVRKAMLRGLSVASPVSDMMNPTPFVADVGQQPSEYLAIMIQMKNECLPIVDEQRKVVDLVFLRDFIDRDSLLNSALLESSMVIMAGGKGKRLWPLTEDTPKPLLPVANRPLLAHILDHAKSQGLKNIWLSTHYKSEQIEAFVETDAPKDLDINVIKETNPLGTAGSLKEFQRKSQQQDDPNTPIFIMNGDILTRLDFTAMLKWHQDHQNIMTVSCRQFSYTVPYGVLDTDDQRLMKIDEKPVKCFNINAGIYLLEREALNYIPDDTYFDMTDLIQALIDARQLVGTFPISEPWIDIGQHADYEHAQEHSQNYLKHEDV